MTRNGTLHKSRPSNLENPKLRHRLLDFLEGLCVRQRYIGFDF